jgi:hypothetical protein
MSKNDFAAWVRGSFAENDLATLLGQAHTKEEMLHVLGTLG